MALSQGASWVDSSFAAIIHIALTDARPGNYDNPLIPARVDMEPVLDSNARRAKCGRVSNSVGGEPAVISAGILLVDLDSTGCGWPLC
jgi:hypothetical protein